ncbi:MAG: 50S ribosome-binding GTPase, partial [Verrucomicrobia bacterium]|nr:50S ribosome-binding GTPase [Verrucomicrobiota bacterium]
MAAVEHLRSLTLVTAGHVDHGKSALVQALTGVHPDRLPEEQARGMTIDLGFGHFDLISEDEPKTTCRFGVIDVPGHEDFVKNMAAGVSAASLALLAVAADDGWMPQTEEHLQILEYLGVTRGVIALTKSDLRPDASGIAHTIRRQLAGTAFAEARIVPASTVGEPGLGELRGSLLEIARSLPPAPDAQKPRLSVDRVFSPKGIGTVVTGTLTGGALRRGQLLAVQPRGGSVRVRSLQSHGRELECSLPGTRTALALAEVAPGGIRRGDTLVLPGLGQPSRTLDAFVTRSARPARGRQLGRALENGALVWVCHGTDHHQARLVLSAGEGLKPGDAAWAQLRFRDPVYA